MSPSRLWAVLAVSDSVEFLWEMRVVGAGSRPSQDRAAVVDRQDGLRVALADGVGGQSGGEQAAQRAVEEWLASPLSPELALAESDSALSQLASGGQSTAIYLHLGEGQLRGASVGDSQVWFQEANRTWTELTEHQRRKPFLGSREAIPTPFSRVLRSSGRLLVCSDGLWRSLNRPRLWELAERGQVDEMIRAARGPLTGELLDDVSLVWVSWGP